MTRAILTVLAMMAVPTLARAGDQQWQVGTAPSFSSGKYGTGTTTEVLHTPVTARRLFDAGDVTVVIPFTCIRGNSGVVMVNGTATRTDLTAGRGDSTERDGTRTGTPPPLPRVTTCGLGDVVVRGRYYVVDEHGWAPTIAVRGHVKTPTATGGLGTGRPDEGVGIEVSRSLGGSTLAMVDGGYTVIGEPAGADFNNNWWYDVGIAQDLAGGVVSLSVFFESYRAIVPGYPDARDILMAVSLKGAGGWRIQVSGEIGLSDGAPDHGVTIGASRRF